MRSCILGSMWILSTCALAFLAVGCGRRSEDTPSPAPPPAPTSRGPLTEAQKITALLDAIEKIENATFIRNNEEYPTWAGRQWLERKLAATTEPIRTAERFIETVATGSWKTGQAYRVKFADGRTTESAYWLRARLAEIEQGAH